MDATLQTQTPHDDHAANADHGCSCQGRSTARVFSVGRSHDRGESGQTGGRGEVTARHWARYGIRLDLFGRASSFVRVARVPLATAEARISLLLGRGSPCA